MGFVHRGVIGAPELRSAQGASAVGCPEADQRFANGSRLRGAAWRTLRRALDTKIGLAATSVGFGLTCQTALSPRHCDAVKLAEHRTRLPVLATRYARVIHHP